MYNKIQNGSGYTAALIGLIYGIWAVIAAVAGHDTGVWIPVDVAVPAMTAIIVLTVTSIVMRVAEHLKRQLIETLISDGVALIVAGVDSKLQANNASLREVLKTKLQSHQQQLQQMVKTEVATALEENSTRTYRAAVVKQATDLADASVTHIPTRYGG